jgi:hypothetical protein
MKKILVASAIAALFAATPVIAADNTPAATGKPGASSQPTPPTEGQMGSDKGSMGSNANGSSMGTTGNMSKDMPGSADSKKKDSSLSTNGAAPKQ